MKYEYDCNFIVYRVRRVHFHVHFILSLKLHRIMGLVSINGTIISRWFGVYYTCTNRQNRSKLTWYKASCLIFKVILLVILWNRNIQIHVESYGFQVM